MPLKPCPDCERQISTEAPACPHCGRPFVTQPQPSASAKQVRRQNAARYNQLSWCLFAVSLTIGYFLSGELGALLFIAAFVLAILHHVNR